MDIRQIVEHYGGGRMVGAELLLTKSDRFLGEWNGYVSSERCLHGR